MPIDVNVIDPASGNSARISRDGSVSVSGTLLSVPVSASRSIITGCTGSGATILIAKRREGFSIYNHSTTVLYLTFGESASTSSFSVALTSNAFYESQNAYSGPVAGVWDSPVTGSAQVTEYI